MLHASTPFHTTPFVDEDERPMLRDVIAGVVLGMVVFAAVTTVIVRLAFADQSWGFALAVGGFAGFWAGLFFGSAAGIIVYQRHLAAAETSAADSISEPRPASGSEAATDPEPRTAARR